MPRLLEGGQASQAVQVAIQSTVGAVYWLPLAPPQAQPADLGLHRRLRARRHVQERANTGLDERGHAPRVPWYLRGMRDALPMPFVFLVIFFATVLGWSLRGLATEAAPDPERARFMLECVTEWGYDGRTCKEILNGKVPPPLDESGC